MKVTKAELECNTTDTALEKHLRIQNTVIYDPQNQQGEEPVEETLLSSGSDTENTGRGSRSMVENDNTKNCITAACSISQEKLNSEPKVTVGVEDGQNIIPAETFLCDRFQAVMRSNNYVVI